MKETFVCCDCEQTYPRGLDVERDFYLGDSEAGGSRCVFCYNKKTHYPLDVELCYQHAYNIEHYGVAILPKQMQQQKGQ